MSHFAGCRKSLLAKRTQERGAALVEFALVSLLFVFFIYAVAVYGVVLSTKNSITHAAAEGARSSLSVADLPAATLDARRITQATTTAGNSLSGTLGSHYHPSDISSTIAGCDSPADTHKCMTVTITYPWSSDPIVPLAPGMGLITPNTIHTTAVVRLN